jgi:hypothetical protein
MYTPARTVKGFETIRILPGGGNQPSLPQQAGSIVGFAGTKPPLEHRGTGKGQGCASCEAAGMQIGGTELLLLAALGAGGYYLYKKAKAGGKWRAF